MAANPEVLLGDCRAILPTLEAGSVQCCVTSPPYWGLRDYGTAQWEGGEVGCDHIPDAETLERQNGRASTLVGTTTSQKMAAIARYECKCGARRIDSQLGLEATPQEYITNMVAVFREVWRVLRDDGTLWVNLGDSYASSNGQKTITPQTAYVTGRALGEPFAPAKKTLEYKTKDAGIKYYGGLKPKDLCMMPARVALALQADGWVLRQEIIWEKPNPMPESVRDRCTKSHEMIYMLAKSKWIGSIDPIRITNMDAVWMAAIVDAEGSICFQQNDRDKGPTISVRLSIVNTNKDLLERVAEICGIDGSIDAPSPRIRSNGESGRPVYSWQVTNKKAVSVIAAIIPFLIAKQKQAELAIAVQILNQKHKGRGGYVTTPKDLEYKQKCMEACSSLNRTGNADLSWFKAARPGHWEPQTYVYDAEAIREENSITGKPWGNHRYANAKTDVSRNDALSINAAGRDPGAYWGNGRNKRTVWTIATQPYSDVTLDFAGADYVGYDGKPYKASADCPIHAHLVNRRSQRMAEGGEQLDRHDLRNLDIDARRAAKLIGGHVAMLSRTNGKIAEENICARNPGSTLGNKTCNGHQSYESLAFDAEKVLRTNHTESLSTLPVCNSDFSQTDNEGSAILNNNQNRRTVHALETNSPCNVSAGKISRIDDKPKLPEMPELFDHMPLSSTLLADSDVRPLAQKQPDILNKPSLRDNICQCKEYSQSHFATFPEEIPKLCILAGSKPGDTVLDPFAGSGTVGKVALELGRRAILIELNPAYIELARDRTYVTPGFF